MRISGGTSGGRKEEYFRVQGGDMEAFIVNYVYSTVPHLSPTMAPNTVNNFSPPTWSHIRTHTPIFNVNIAGLKVIQKARSSFCNFVKSVLPLFLSIQKTPHQKTSCSLLTLQSHTYTHSKMCLFFFKSKSFLFAVGRRENSEFSVLYSGTSNKYYFLFPLLSF